MQFLRALSFACLVGLTVAFDALSTLRSVENYVGKLDNAVKALSPSSLSKAAPLLGTVQDLVASLNQGTAEFNNYRGTVDATTSKTIADSLQTDASEVKDANERLISYSSKLKATNEGPAIGKGLHAIAEGFVSLGNAATSRLDSSQVHRGSKAFAAIADSFSKAAQSFGN